MNTLLRLIRYIHRNPTVIVGDERLADYRWSSLRAYLGYWRAPEWLRIDAVVELCGGGVEALRRLVMAPDGPSSCGRAGVDGLLAAIDLMIDENEQASRRSQANRTVAALLLDRLDDSTRVELGRRLAFPTAQAEHAARSRARRRARDQPELADVVNAVIDLAA